MPIVSWRPVSIAILTLVPTPSVPATSTGSLKPGALEVEQPAEAADLGIGARPRGRAHQRLDQLHHAVAGIDVDAGLGIGEAVPVGCHDPFQIVAVSVRWNRSVCNGSIAAILGSSERRPGGRRRAPSRGVPV